MNFNKHANLSGTHAFLSASKHHWVNYDDKRLKQAYVNFLAAQKGTELHEFAAKCIELGIRIKSNNKTLNSYVNDAIGFKMTPEQPLVTIATEHVILSPSAMIFCESMI